MALAKERENRMSKLTWVHIVILLSISYAIGKWIATHGQEREVDVTRL